jgi:hypothetical protein
VTGKPGRPREWTAEEDALLKDLYLEGRSTAYLADRFGTTIENVRQRLSRMGVRRTAAAHQEGPAASASRAVRPRPGEDLAAYLQALSGRQAGPGVEGPRSVSEEIARAYLEDPVRFIDDFAPFRLLPYQEAMVREVHARPYVALICSRQVGKSAIASYYATWYAYTHPGSTILIIAAVERQAALDLEMIRTFVLGSPLLSTSLLEISQTFVRLSTNAKVYSLPAGAEGATIRGFAADVVLLDEAARIPEEVYNAVLPMISTKRDAKLVLATTPRGMSGFVWNATRSPIWKVVTVKATDSSLISAEYLEEMKRTMPEDAFRMEFLAEFVDESTSAFPFALLDAAEDPELEMET